MLGMTRTMATSPSTDEIREVLMPAAMEMIRMSLSMWPLMSSSAVFMFCGLTLRTRTSTLDASSALLVAVRTP